MNKGKLFNGLPRELAIAWAAGFLDGEGTIGVYIRRENGHIHGLSVFVAACQTDPRPLLLLRELWGGSVTMHKSKNSLHADCYRWRGAKETVKHCCRDIQPYLMVKRAQAELALEVVSRARRARRPGLTAADHAEDLEYRRLFAALNRTGVSISLEAEDTKPIRRKPPQLRLMEAI